MEAKYAASKKESLSNAMGQNTGFGGASKITGTNSFDDNTLTASLGGDPPYKNGGNGMPDALTGFGLTAGVIQNSADAVQKGFSSNPVKNQVNFKNTNVIGKGSRIAGGTLALGSLGYSAYTLGQDGYSDQDIARLATQSIITGVGFLGPVGLGVSFGLGIIDSAGGFNWIYDSFDNSNDVFE